MALLRLVTDAVPALIAYYDSPQERCRFANQRYAEYNGWTTQTILGKTVREVIGESAYQAIEPHIQKVHEGQTVRYVREQTLPDQGKRMIEVSLIPRFSQTQQWLGTFVLINDITETWQAEQALRDSETRMRKFVDATEEGIAFHLNGVITDANDALLRLGGYTLQEVIGHQMTEFIPVAWRQTVADNFRAGGEAPYESAILHKSGREIPVEMVGKTIPFDGENYRLAVVRDITVRKQVQARMEFMALHDPLTQLPNRIYLNEHLASLLALARRQGSSVAILFIDLDKFKEVNDAQGHQAGDDLLREMALRLRSAVRQSDFVARIGGDEFLVVLTDIAGTQDVARVADTMLETMSMTITAPGRSILVSPSIGISQFPDHGGTADELIRHADTAMYQAKTRGGRAYAFYSPAEGG